MKKIIESLVSLRIWFTGVLFLVLGSASMLLVGIFHRGNFLDKVLKFWCRLIVYTSGIRVTIKGLENFDPAKQYVVMMNHVNMFDGLIILGNLPMKARGIEEESHFKWPVYGWLIRGLGNVPINRKSGRRALESLRKAGEYMRRHEDLSVVIFPEGTRTRTGKLQKIKKGGFLLAVESGLEILPVVQVGGYAVKKKIHWHIRPGHIELIFEKPIPTKGMTRETIPQLIENVTGVFQRYVD
jgi:1-acyl-sn-glycerol-3-phosphate acyltransferase